MDEQDDGKPKLRRETVLPPGSTDLYGHYKTLRQNDGQLIRWKRRPDRGWIRGVCAGLAARFGMPVWKVRVLMALATLLGGFGAAYYLLASTFVPAENPARPA